MDEGVDGVVMTKRMAHLPPVDVLEIVRFLYSFCSDLTPRLEGLFGLEFRERIIDLKGSDFGEAHLDQIERLERLLDQYAQAPDDKRRSGLQSTINARLIRLLRKAKKL